jgi:hypothetical protein
MLHDIRNIQATHIFSAQSPSTTNRLWDWSVQRTLARDAQYNVMYTPSLQGSILYHFIRQKMHYENLCNIADRSPTALSDRPTYADGRRAVGATDMLL